MAPIAAAFPGAVRDTPRGPRVDREALRRAVLGDGAALSSLERIVHPLVRDEESGELRPASWTEAFVVAARGLAAAEGSVGVLTGGRLTAEDA